MMRWIVKSSLTFRLLVVAAAATLLVVGGIQLRNAPSDVLPEFAQPHVEVQTEALGLSAAEVESLVSLNIEELLNSTPWLESIRSTSVPGLSSVVLTFEPGTDVLRARQIVSERLTLAYALPNVSSPPVILQPLSATSRVMTVSLSSTSVSPIEMSVLSRWTIRPALLAVPGVANVSIWGFKDRQLQVLVDPRQLAADKVSLDQIVRTAGNAMWVSPLTYLEASTPGTGGFIDTPQQRLEVRHVFPITGPEGLAQVAVEDKGTPLSDVAKVVEGHPPLIGDAVLKAGPGLLLVVEKFPGADTREVTRGIDETLRGLSTGLNNITVDTGVFRPSTYIDTSIDNLTLVLVIGAVLGLLVLLAFLYQWRAVLISVIAIALSLTAAALVLDWSGATFNAMVLAGLLIGLVVIVDEAIIGVENIMRRLRQHRAEGGDKSTTTVILESTLETYRVAVFVTLIVLLPLVPVLFMTGVGGSLLGPLALAYALAVVAAIVVALTVTPALSLLLLSGTRVGSHESPLASRLQTVYAAVIGRLLNRPNAAFIAAALALVAGAAVVPFLGTTQVPEFKDSNLVVRWDAPAGTSGPEMTRITARLSRELETLKGVGSAAGQVGRAILGDQVTDINSAEVFVNVKADADYDVTVNAVRDTVAGYPGMRSDVQTIQKRSIGRAESGSDDPITVSIFGPRLDVLRAKEAEVRGALESIPGVDALNLEQRIEQPHVEVQVDLAKAQRYGLKPGDVRREAATLLAGLEVGSLFEEQKVFQVAVWSNPASRHSPTDISDLLINTPSGDRVALGKVADVSIKSSPAVIRHEAVSRRVKIGLSVSGRDAGSVMRDVESRLKSIAFPLEYHAEVRGESSTTQSSRRYMIGTGIAAAVLIFLLLQAVLGGWRLAGLVWLALAAAISGGVFAASIAGDDVSLGSLLGFLAVLAIAARNGVLLIDRYRRLEREEGMPFGRELVIRGARERLVPIVLTAAAIVLALIPLLATGGAAGQEIANPIAVIVLGGLVTSTALTLFVLPSLYLRFGAGSVHPADV